MITCECLNEEVEFYYQNDALCSYLVLSFATEQKIIWYQAEMILNNPSVGIIPFQVRQVDNRYCIYYDITSKISLNQFLKRKTLKKYELISILSGIINVLIDSRNLLLWDKSFLICSEYMFVNPITLEISLVYLPIKYEQDISSKVKELVKDIIINVADLDCSEGENFVLQILNYIKGDVFNVREFVDLLWSINGTIQQKENTYGEQKTSNEVNYATEKASDIIVPISSLVENDESVWIKRHNGISIILVQLLLCIGVLLVIVNFQNIDAISLIGMVIVAGALDFFIIDKLSGGGKVVSGLFKNLLVGREKVENEKLKQENQGNNISWEILDTKHTKDNGLGSDVNQNNENQGETVFLRKKHEAGAYLVLYKNGVEHREKITKDSFLIGRLSEQVDYLSENIAVGKIHAEILCEKGKYYIRDLNSKNGTHINGSKITSNTEYIIDSGDVISLADEQYTFLLEEEA